MKFKIAEKILFRVPQFPMHARLEDSWIELKRSIKIASPDFYKEIDSLKYADLDKLENKIQQTIHKYFNRARFRPVPYGTFASIGLIEPKGDDHSKEIILEPNQQVMAFIDWPFKDQLNYTFDDVVNSDDLLFTNSTYYKIPNGIRYVFKNESGFELADLEVNETILLILERCRQPKRIHSIVHELSSKLNNMDDLWNIIANMISEQLLFTEHDPNIIGQDFFERREIANSLEAHSYIIAKRKYISGGLDRQLLKHFPGLIRIQNRLTTSEESIHLSSFKTAFSKRYDRMEVAIMNVLDPELGIGYGSMEQSGETSDPILELLRNKHNLPNHGNDENEILGKLLANCINGETVFLDQLVIKSEDSNLTSRIPNVIGAMFSVTDGLLHLNHFGGVTTNQLAARFSITSDAIYNYCKEMAEVEQKANPEVLFFDIGYMAESRVDNVNRRKQIYDQQLSIMNFDTSSEPITLDDLTVSIRNGQVMLRSKKYNKRMVPRVASAYNHTRSDLPLFRFLCDLSYQGLQSNLTLDLQTLYPRLKYYPRIQYHNIIVSPQKWLLSVEEINEQATDETDPFHNYLMQLKVSKFIKAGHADQTLLLDITSKKDRGVIYSLLKRERTIIVEEVTIPTQSVIKDEIGNSFLGQFLVSIVHHEAIYKGYEMKACQLQTQRFYSPGSEWLYFEIHCHPRQADNLLIYQIGDFLKNDKSLIKQFFFLRYNEDGEHLRLRLKLYDPASAGHLMKCLHELLSDKIESGIVSNLLVKTYVRELERYGSGNIEHVEAHFAMDSAFVIEVLGFEYDDQTKYKIIRSLFEHILLSGIFNNEELLTWFMHVRNSFAHEHQIKPEGFKKLNQFISEVMIQTSITSLPVMLKHQQVCESLFRIVNSCAEEQRFTLFTDLMHMHINRMFSEHQRSHELVVYEMIICQMKKERAMLKQRTNLI